MSLNWREIQAVLDELPLVDSHIQRIVQPDFRNIYLEIFRPGRRFTLRICLETGRTRLHTASSRPRKPQVRQRFAQFLQSRIKGGRIVLAKQVNADRIVRVDVERGGELTILWIRLWGGAANIVATERDGTVLDAFFRRPGKGEVTGGHYYVEDQDLDPESDAKRASFSARWQGDVDESVRDHYASLERDEAHERAREQAESALRNQIGSVRRRLRKLEGKNSQDEDPERLRTLGDLILTNLHRIEPGARWVDVEDYTQDNARITIELEEAATPQENAERYYERAQKATRRQNALQEETANLHARVTELEEKLEQLDDCSTAELAEIASTAPARGGRADSGSELPGLQFESGGFTILVGRNARENDALLRRHVRGNDLWLHARDFPGGYVFIKSKRGKSVPLDVLLDAGNLAVHYSRAKNNGRADLYYTQVKYLRRAREGPKGLVLPTQEKNLHVVLDEQRLSRLLGPRTA